MARVYEIGVSKAAAATATAYGQLRAAATTRLRIREIGISQTTAVASSIGLIRPATEGTASTTQAPQAIDPADTATSALFATAWSTPATIGTIYMRKIVLPATIGAGIVWQWPDDSPLTVPINSSILLWNFAGATSAAVEIYISYEE
jgi:hypothetical protein